MLAHVPETGQGDRGFGLGFSQGSRGRFRKWKGGGGISDTVAMAEGAPASGSPWLHGPRSDLLLGAGLVYLPVLAALVLAGDGLRAALPAGLLPLLLLLLNAPHLGATLLRVYERPEDRRRYRLFAVHATLLIGAAFLVGLYVPIVGSILITLYLSVVPWHFTGQNYGIALIFLRRRGVDVPRELQRFLYVSFVSSFAMTLLALHGRGITAIAPVDPSGTVYSFLSIGIPDRVYAYALVILGFVYLGSLMETGFRLRGRAPLADLLPAAAVVLSQAVWFSVPVVFHAFAGPDRLGPLAPARYAYTSVWISLAHAVQYLWITTYYAERQRPGTGALPFLGRALLAGSAIYGVPILLLAPGVLGPVPYDFGLLVMVAGALNLHHVLLDGAIWKLRSGPIARILIRGVADAAPESRRPAARVAPVRLAVWASGALGAALMVLGTVEYEFGYLRAHARGDLTRLEAAERRLSWLGRGDPSLSAAVGILRAEHGDRAGALEALRRSVALLPRAAAWVDIGVVQERGGELAAALEADETALALEPDSVPALHYAGRAWAKDGQLERARALLERAALLAPGDAEVRRALEAVRRRASPPPARSW